MFSIYLIIFVILTVDAICINSLTIEPHDTVHFDSENELAYFSILQIVLFDNFHRYTGFMIFINFYFLADSDGNSEAADETTENDENSDLNTSDTELTGTTTNSTAALMSARYNREDPLKGVGQLTTAVRKWATDYLSNCRSKRKTANNGIPAISLRMHKWKVVLENGYHKVRKQPDAVKPTPSNWSKW